jgi:two-component system CheB/CheR fusion protein
MTAPPSRPTLPSAAPLHLVLVGLGSSAGGLDALRSFFDAVPEDCTLTFVVVSHAYPDRPTLLPELLRLRAKLPVSEIVDGEVAQASHVYVPPSWSKVELINAKFHLTPFNALSERSRRIDHFFVSLAQELQTHCAGVVLSGGGCDGTRGIESIAAHGGLTLAQTPSTAEESSMPACAIATGQVRHIVAAQEMPAVIIQHFSTLGPQWL